MIVIGFYVQKSLILLFKQSEFLVRCIVFQILFLNVVKIDDAQLYSKDQRKSGNRKISSYSTLNTFADVANQN